MNTSLKHTSINGCLCTCTPVLRSNGDFCGVCFPPTPEGVVCIGSHGRLITIVAALRFSAFSYYK